MEAYGYLRAEDPDAPPLILAGAKGWYYQSLFERACALGLARYVIFTGYASREEQALWYAGATLFLYLSLPDRVRVEGPKWAQRFAPEQMARRYLNAYAAVVHSGHAHERMSD